MFPMLSFLSRKDTHADVKIEKKIPARTFFTFCTKGRKALVQVASKHLFVVLCRSDLYSTEVGITQCAHKYIATNPMSVTHKHT